MILIVLARAYMLEYHIRFRFLNNAIDRMMEYGGKILIRRKNKHLLKKALGCHPSPESLFVFLMGKYTKPQLVWFLIQLGDNSNEVSELHLKAFEFLAEYENALSDDECLRIFRAHWLLHHHELKWLHLILSHNNKKVLKKIQSPTPKSS